MVDRKRIFTLNSSNQLKVENEISDAVDPAQLNFISIDDLVDHNIPNQLIKFIVCEICKGLANNPVQDKKCQKCLCSFCLENALKLD